MNNDAPTGEWLITMLGIGAVIGAGLFILISLAQ